MRWKTVQIPLVLYEECTECHDKVGHPSVASLAREAIRRYLDELNKTEANPS